MEPYTAKVVSIRRRHGPVRRHGLPFRLPELQGWMADLRQCQTAAWKASDKGFPARIDPGDEDDHIAMLGAVSAVTPHDHRTSLPNEPSPNRSCTTLALILRSASTAAKGVDQDGALIAEVTGIEPCCKDRVPLFVFCGRHQRCCEPSDS